MSVNQRLVNGRPLGVTSEGAVGLGRSAQRESTAVGSRIGLLGLVGVVGTALLLCLAAPSTVAMHPQSTLELPPVVHLRGLFGGSALQLRAGELIGALVLMFGSYLLAVRYSERVSPRAVLTAIALFIAIVVVAPPLFSTDIFSYQAYGRMFTIYGANPYLHGPNILSLAGGGGDVVYPYIGTKWVSTPSVYGPVFTLISAVFASASVAVSAFVFKGIAAVSCAIMLVLTWHAARMRGLNPARAVALVGLNPLVILYGVGGGHNDLLMVALTTAGICAMLAHRERTAGAMVVLGTAIKLTGGLVFPFALASRPGLGARGRRRSLLIGATAAATVVIAAGFAAFGTGLLQMPVTLDRVQNLGSWQSVPGFFTTALRMQGVGHELGLVLGIAFVALTCRLVYRVWHGEIDWLDGLGWSTLALLLTTSALLPWYVTWLLPPVALGTTARLRTATLCFSGWVLFTTLLQYIPHGVAFLGI